MADKKQPQWSIDRAFKMTYENSSRLRTLLSLIYKVQLGELNEENALIEATKLQVITSPERYTHSTQTLLNSYGLLENAFTLSETAIAFVNGKITFSELMLLQIYKKEYRYDSSSPVLRPLLVTIGVLLELRNNTHNCCWIDFYDYAIHLTEINSYNQINAEVQKMVSEKADSSFVRKTQYNSVSDYDMWVGAFESTKLLKNVTENDKYTLTLNEEYLDLAIFLWNSRDVAPIINEYVSSRIGTDKEKLERKRDFGNLSKGLFDVLPHIQLGNKFTLPKLNFDINEILRKYIVENKTEIEIERELLKTDRVCGYLVKTIIESQGILAEEAKGIFAPFKSFPNVMQLNPNYTEEEKQIISKIFPIESYKMTNYSYQANRVKGGFNKIYYGIPGCGKSFKVTSMLSYKTEFQKDANSIGITEKVADENIIRTTFFLDYTNSDFVGQLMPKTEGDKVVYRPVMGPFTKALKRACETEQMVYLVIEEINRGNSAAIFGDLFQLLDRYKTDKDTHLAGDSMYPITNEFIEDCLGLKTGEIIIPSNLTILATMNTSDQNVFPLDTAFKRRWSRERIVPNWEAPSINEFVNMFVPFTDIKWCDFAKRVNQKLSCESQKGLVLEDKQLGPFFINSDSLCQTAFDQSDVKLQSFVNNVIDYLYNDVTKFDHSILFDTFNGYDDLYNKILEVSPNKPKINGLTMGIKEL